MNHYIPEIISALLSLLVGFILIRLQGRPKIIFWQSYVYMFKNIIKQNIIIQTQTISIQNAGREAAKSIEIIHQQKPDHFELAPFVPFKEIDGPNKEHVIQLEYLGPKETVNLQILSYKEPPQFIQIRSESGSAKLQHHIQTPYVPKWALRLTQFLMLLGLGLFLYIFIKIGIYLVPLVF